MKGFHGTLNANYDGTQPAGLKRIFLELPLGRRGLAHLLSPKSSGQHARPVQDL